MTDIDLVQLTGNEWFVAEVYKGNKHFAPLRLKSASASCETLLRIIKLFKS